MYLHNWLIHVHAICSSTYMYMKNVNDVTGWLSQTTDISKYFVWSPGLWDKESRLYLVRSIYVSHWSIIPTMMFIHQIILKILSKITRPWHIGHVDLFTLRSKFGSHCLIIWKYDTHASSSLGDIRQNHWTMKYRSHRHTFILRSNVGSYWLIIPMYYVHISNSLQDINKTTVPWNIGHSDLH